MSLDVIREEIERRKVEIQEIEKMIRVMKKAGESTAELEARLIQAKNLIARWERALAEEG